MRILQNDAKWMVETAEEKDDNFVGIGPMHPTRQSAENSAEAARSRGVYAIRILEVVITYYRPAAHESKNHYAVIV